VAFRGERGQSCFVGGGTKGAATNRWRSLDKHLGKANTSGSHKRITGRVLGTSTRKGLQNRDGGRNAGSLFPRETDKVLARDRGRSKEKVLKTRNWGRAAENGELGRKPLLESKKTELRSRGGTKEEAGDPNTHGGQTTSENSRCLMKGGWGGSCPRREPQARGRSVHDRR